MMGSMTVAIAAAWLMLGSVSNAAVEIATSQARKASSQALEMQSGTALPNPGAGMVSAVEVAPSINGVDVVLGADAGLDLAHFTLDNPSRIVVDIAGARLAIPSSYDGRTRGPVRNVRLSQYRSDTVRVVIDLDKDHYYTVERDGDLVRVSLEAADVVAFAPWNVGQLSQSQRATADGQLVFDTDPLGADFTNSASDTIQPTLLSELSTAKTDAAQPGSVAEVPLKPAIPASPTSRTSALRQDQQPRPRITVSYDGTDIRDVIAAFAAFSGRTIVVGKNVEGAVTADIADKPWDVALQAILQAQGLAATEDASGIIAVDSYRNLAQNQALEPLITQIVDVNYAKAVVLRSTVQSLLARDCTGMTTALTGRDMGMGMASSMNQGGGMDQQNSMAGQGCVVRGSVSADSATNKLIITEVPSRLPEIIARLQQLDVRTPQVAIKAKIVFVNRTGIQDIGIAYDLGQGNKQFFQQLVPRTDPNTLQAVDTDGDGVPDAMGGGSPFEGPARINLGGNAIAGIANANNAIKPNALNLIYSTAIGRYQLTAFLNALQTSSLAEVQSEPSVTILNNRSAEIFVGQEIPIRVIDASAGGQGGATGGGGGGGGAGQQPNAAAFFPRATVSKEEAGIKLSVTPQITNNKMVMLNIKAENSSAELAATDVGVIFNRQRAESQVLVADGEAAVIGGLTVTETTNYRSGIPVLMNLPFVGRLFSQNTKNEAKRDLLILVTPHILDEGVTPPNR